MAFHRQAGMLEDCQGMATLLLCQGTGTQRASPGCWHSDEVLSHHRHGARVLQVLCEDTEALLGYRDTRNMCMARGTGAGYSVPVLAEMHGVGCHQDTSAVPG